MGMAKPMPAASSTRTVTMPITSPRWLSSGPPELPGLMATSVWMSCSMKAVLRPEGTCSVRLRALTMPPVTVC